MKKACIVLLSVLAASSFGQSQSISLSQKLSAGLLTFWKTNYSLAGNVLSADFLTAPYPTVTVKNNTGENWSNWDAILIDVTNLEPEPIQVFVRLDDSFNATGLTNSRTGFSHISAGVTKTLAFPLRLRPEDYGMKALPGLQGSEWLSMNNGSVNIGNICLWKLYIQNGAGPTRHFRFSNPRLVVGTATLTNMIDEFGQFRYANWLDKVTTLSEILLEDQLEQADITLHPTVPGQDFRGGWSSGPTSGTSERFYTKKVGTKWWLVTPEGKLFLSFGMGAVNSGQETIIQGRETMFNSLPLIGDPLNTFFDAYNGQKTFQFYRANLYRKYGSGWFNATNTRSLARMRSWGFNTLGSWSEPQMWDDDKVPYTVQVDLSGTYPTLSVDPGRKALADPFDPTFRTAVRARIAEQLPVAINDPWCVGWFVDNEPTFLGPSYTEESGRYGIAYATMAKPISSLAKYTLVQQLKGRYSSIASLNTSWGSTYSSWAAVEAAQTLSEPSSAGRKADFQTFCRTYARTYLQVLKESLREVDTKALYLGCRFFRFSPEVLDAANSYCNVISFNVYAPSITNYWDTFNYLTKPFMVTEFHFGALDAGLFHPGLQQVSSQAERGTAFEAYVRSVVDHPMFVGCHWFQYIDQPTTGRPENGENYNCGFVSGTDVPYAPLVSAARRVHAEAYARRYNN